MVNNMVTNFKCKSILHRIITNSPLSVLVSALYLLLVVASAIIIAPFIVDYSTKINMGLSNLEPFSLSHGFLYVLGSDNLGRSLLAKIIYASQTTLIISCSTVAISLIIGGVLGTLSGYHGGITSVLIMRLTDALMSFPLLLLSILLLYILQAQNSTIIIVLAISRIPLLLRVTHAEVLKVRELLFISAAKTMNISNYNILRKHVAPNIFPTLLTFSALEVSIVMLAESSLSFIGLGVQAPNLSWGMLVAQGTQYLNTSWWLATLPGAMIVFTALSCNIISTHFRKVLDPKSNNLNSGASNA